MDKIKSPNYEVDMRFMNAMSVTISLAGPQELPKITRINEEQVVLKMISPHACLFGLK